MSEFIFSAAVFFVFLLAFVACHLWIELDYEKRRRILLEKDRDFWKEKCDKDFELFEVGFKRLLRLRMRIEDALRQDMEEAKDDEEENGGADE